MGYVYKIFCKDTEQLYIGQTKDNIQARWDTHIVDLMRNKHVNPYIQYAWNKYGSKSFEFFVLEECDNDVIFQTESQHIDNMLRIYEPHMLFNIVHNSKHICEQNSTNITYIEPVPLPSKEDQYIQQFDAVKESVKEYIVSGKTKIVTLYELFGVKPGSAKQYKVFSQLYNELYNSI